MTSLSYYWLEAGSDGTVVRIIIGSVLGSMAALLVIVGVLMAVLVYCHRKRSGSFTGKKEQ